MMKTNWNESSCIGVRQIDKDHERLIKILEQIQEHQYDNVRSEAISTIIDQLREFVSCCLRNEEEYMLKIGFPGYQAHIKQHKQFRKKNAALCIDVMNHKEIAPQDIYNFLSDWVANHFPDSDKKLQVFLEAKKAHNETVCNCQSPVGHPAAHIYLLEK
jgi:hemerythrin-like metal-binding protein